MRVADSLLSGKTEQGWFHGRSTDCTGVIRRHGVATSTAWERGQWSLAAGLRGERQESDGPREETRNSRR